MDNNSKKKIDTAAEIQWIESCLQKMTLPEKAAQMVFPALYAEFINKESAEWNDVLSSVNDLKIGGFCIRGDDLFSYTQLINTLQKESRVPLLLCADVERGPGDLFKAAVSFPPNMALGAVDDTDITFQTARAAARECLALGIPLILGPVADVNSNPFNPVINIRSFGEDPELVSCHSLAFIRGIREEGAFAAAKHFPGHGDVDEDSHLVITKKDTDLEQLQKTELAPFCSAVSENVDLVMTSHIWLPSLCGSDKEMPATFCKKIVTDLLKEQLGFKGIVITDSMNMNAVTENYSLAEAAGYAAAAGHDIILDVPNIKEAIKGIVEQVENGAVPAVQIDSSVRKILQLKFRAGLLNNSSVNSKEIHTLVGNRETKALAKKAAEKSLTLLRNEKKIIPVRLGNDSRLTIVDIFSGRASLKMSCIAKKFLERWPDSEYYALNRNICRFLAKDFYDTIKESDLILWNIFKKPDFKSGKIDLSGILSETLKLFRNADRPILAVSFGSPYIYSSIPYVDAYVCAYGDSEIIQEAVFDAVSGNLPFTGKLPVSIPEYYKRGSGLS